MANTIKTLSDGDITRKALSILHNELVFCKTINKQYDSSFARSGAKNGGSLLIREPNQFTVRTGAIMDTQDVTESTQTLTVATQKGVDINFSSVELTLSMDDFSERILQPAMSRLAAEVDATVIAGCYPYIYNHTHTTFGTAPVLTDVLKARTKLARGLAPRGDRYFLCDANAANSVISNSYNIFNPSSEISRQYDQGLIGQVYGFKFYESEMTPTHTNGSRGDTTPVCDTSGSGLTSGSSTIAITNCSNSATFKAGDVFTLAGVYAVNPETKTAYDHLQQFSVITAITATSTAVSLTVTPTPVTSGAKMNCKVVTAASNSAMVNLTAGGSGAASTSYINSLAYHKDAFTIVTADLEMPQGVDFAARKVMDGISLRLVRNYDIVNDKFPCRIDVLFGYKCLRPEWACRVSS